MFHCGYVKNHWIVHFKRVNYMVCELYSNFLKKQKWKSLNFRMKMSYFSAKYSLSKHRHSLLLLGPLHFKIGSSFWKVFVVNDMCIDTWHIWSRIISGASLTVTLCSPISMKSLWLSSLENLTIQPPLIYSQVCFLAL